MNESFKNGFWGMIGAAAGLWVVDKIVGFGRKKPEKPERMEKTCENKTEVEKPEE